MDHNRRVAINFEVNRMFRIRSMTQVIQFREFWSCCHGQASSIGSCTSTIDEEQIIVCWARFCWTAEETTRREKMRKKEKGKYDRDTSVWPMQLNELSLFLSLSPINAMFWEKKRWTKGMKINSSASWVYYQKELSIYSPGIFRTAFLIWHYFLLSYYIISHNETVVSVIVNEILVHTEEISMNHFAYTIEKRCCMLWKCPFSNSFRTGWTLVLIPRSNRCITSWAGF